MLVTVKPLQSKTYFIHMFVPAETLTIKTVPMRLATFLLERSDKKTGLISDLTYLGIADTLGIQRETVSAILRDFKYQGLVELGYQRITIVNHTLLTRIMASLND